MDLVLLRIHTLKIVDKHVRLKTEPRSWAEPSGNTTDTIPNECGNRHRKHKQRVGHDRDEQRSGAQQATPNFPLSPIPKTRGPSTQNKDERMLCVHSPFVLSQMNERQW